MPRQKRFPRIIAAKVDDVAFMTFHDLHPGAVSARIRTLVEREVGGDSPEAVLRRINDVVKGPLPWSAADARAARIRIAEIIDGYGREKR